MIDERIILIRDQRVIIDADLAELYAVSTKALNQAVKRNATRFPSDFMFQLSAAEKQEVVTKCDHLTRLKFSKSLPFAFTEHGAIQAANILSSDQAVEMGIYVVRAFVRIRSVLVSNTKLAARVDELEKNSEFTREQIRQILDLVRQMTAPLEQKKRSIGFVIPEEK